MATFRQGSGPWMHMRRLYAQARDADVEAHAMRAFRERAAQASSRDRDGGNRGDEFVRESIQRSYQ